MKIIHISDTHFTYCNEKARKHFLQGINNKISQGGEIILLTGDISESPTLTSELFWLSENIKRPLYYILGNHDFYHSNFEIGRQLAKTAQNFSNLKQFICYLPSRQYVKLNTDTVLFGFDGLYDCRNYKKDEISDFIDGISLQNDFVYNSTLKNICDYEVPIETKLKVFRHYADRETKSLTLKLNNFFQSNYDIINKIIIATHVPPIYYRNPKIEYQYDLPGFDSNKNLMDLLEIYSEKYRNKQFIVFCGHNHFGGFTEQDNLKIYCKASTCDSPNSILVEI